MKDKEFDDLMRIAIANTLQPEPPAIIEEAIASAGRAPLACLIDALLSEQPNIRFRGTLEAIANLNQGTVEDLDTPAFQSYIVGSLGVSEAHLQQCMRSIEVFSRVMRADAQQRFIAAARDDAAGGVGPISIDEIRDQLRKRKE